ncbi:glucokinase [Arthrobacter sp. PAMC 25486]|uniref:ROK family protein n=1 Tax=Arthrobacter sp. PAMC 25486 TaxID=1494608 RepID=UPI000536098C|nr:ROK family protein [Arthrobacter sp. PAMC 25486]AIY00959.1 glucokinase [Arthrobacter sp. PAMC 25486]
MSPEWIGVDIGGTKIAAGLVDANGQVLARVQKATPEGEQAIANTVVEAILELQPEVSGTLVGIAVPGYVSTDHRSVLYAANLELENTKLADLIEAKLDITCLVINDANAALWAEFRFGAARTAQNVAMVTIGTGIGGGLLINGQLVAGAHGWAGEIGHMVVDPGGRACGCGSRGCLDRYASGSTLTKHAQTSEDFAEIARWLGFGLSQVSMLLDPDLILLGGGVSAAGAALVKPTQEKLAELLAEHGRDLAPQVRSAELGPDAGFIGAAAYAADNARVSPDRSLPLAHGLLN